MTARLLTLGATWLVAVVAWEPAMRLVTWLILLGAGEQPGPYTAWRTLP